ncbi:MAG: hypothetical protein QOC89_4875 [Paraburkholderia sp.]|nr:hypothetical protein [Paraburkholderia sp.]
MPHHGQGANQSIEDAVVLAAQLASAGPGNWCEAQEAYERVAGLRGRPVGQVRTSAVVIDAYCTLRVRPRRRRLRARDSVLNHLDWIHDFDTVTAEPSERQGGTWL